MTPERQHRRARRPPHHQRQRHCPQQQQHPARRRHQHLHLAAPPRRVRGARGDGGDGQHLDRQLRRRAGHGRRRRDHRAHQVRDQRVPRVRPSCSRERGPPGPQLLQPPATSPRAARKIGGRHPGRPDHQGQAVLLRRLGRPLRDESRTRGPGTLPTEAMRAGDFSAFGTTIYDPVTGDPDGTGRTPFPGNIIPADRISPIAAQLQARSPCPTATASSATTPTPGSRLRPQQLRLQDQLQREQLRPDLGKYCRMDALVYSDIGWEPERGRPSASGSGGVGSATTPRSSWHPRRHLDGLAQARRRRHHRP